MKLCTRLMEMLLTTAYKSKIIKFKLDEDLLQFRIYVLTFVESLEVISPQYKQTCEVLIGFPKIGGVNTKYFAKKWVRYLLRDNTDVHSRRLITESPGDGIKCIEKLQSHCANMTFSDKIMYDRIFQQVTHKGGEYVMNYINIFQNSQSLPVYVENNYS